MVLVDLPVPPGFTVHSDDFTALVEAGRIARFQVQNGNVLVYLRELTANAPLELSYRLRATMAVKINAPGGGCTNTTTRIARAVAQAHG